MTVECPAEGCSETWPTEDSACGHYSGTGDDAHKGGYKRAKELLEQRDSGETTSEESPEETTEATESKATGENPAFDGPEPDPSGGAGAGDVPPEVNEGCPECGGELADFRGTDDYQRGGTWYRTPADFYCGDCGQGFDHK